VVLCAVVGSGAGWLLRYEREPKPDAPEEILAAARAPETKRAASVPEKQADVGGGGFGEKTKNDAPQKTDSIYDMLTQGMQQAEQAQAGQKPLSGVWVDVATGLMWTAEDTDTDLDWLHASGYCSSLRLGDFTGWRLPSSHELATVLSNPQLNKTGGIQLYIAPTTLWTAGTEKDRDDKEYAEAFYRYQGRWNSEDDKPVEEKARALCVHDKI